ncbi:putative eka-like protein [Erysiphe necator]|uniref:Putative eka-like protein n=1 Tax=Uncinula necator TaxID=52586 RepID=A0A0B1P8X7_UNCNE|nr:putative eka-like protein [Erysiphe necator]
MKEKEIDRNMKRRVTFATPRIIPSQVPSRGSYKNAELLKTSQSGINSCLGYSRTQRSEKGKDKSKHYSTSGAMDKTSHRSINKDKSENTTSSTKAISDKKLLLRLPPEHEWRKLSPASVRRVMVKKLYISSSLVGKIKPVHSSFALSPSNSEAREEMLKAGLGLLLSGVKLEPATIWVSVLVLTVPAFIQIEQGKVEVSKSMLSDEIKRVCSVRPANIKLFGQNNP